MLGSCQPAYASDAINIIKAEEGFSASPYTGPEGYIHIGYGYKLHSDLGQDPNDFLLRINKEMASDLLEIQVQGVRDALLLGRNSSTFNKQNQATKDVLISMTYQLGYTGVSKFTRMWSALEVGNMDIAAKEALDSRWYIQTPNRATRHAYTIETSKPYVY